MALEWIHENPPHWDAHKQAIILEGPPGVFELGDRTEGDLIPGEWWRVEDGGQIVGYGWMDTTWGDAEILLAVAPSHRKHGVGTFIVEHLALEATARGLNYLYNVVRPTHPERQAVTGWLLARQFAESSDGLLKRRVRPE